MSNTLYKKAIKGKVYMGLNNKVCKHPKYWCRLHKIYLSEPDVIKKHCKNKYTFDMISQHRCGELEEI